MNKEQMKFVVPEGFELKIIDEDILNPDKQWEGWYPDGTTVGEIHYGEWSVAIDGCGEMEVRKTNPDGDGWKGNCANSISDLARMEIYCDSDFWKYELEHEANPWFGLGDVCKNGEKNQNLVLQGWEWYLPDDQRGEFETNFDSAIQCAVDLLKENKRLDDNGESKYAKR